MGCYFYCCIGVLGGRDFNREERKIIFFEKVWGGFVFEFVLWRSDRVVSVVLCSEDGNGRLGFLGF